MFSNVVNLSAGRVLLTLYVLNLGAPPFAISIVRPIPTFWTRPINALYLPGFILYWLWEPATDTVIHTLTIPRAQIVMAAGQASADAKEFELVATRDSESFGIRSAPFLEYAFKTVEFWIKVTINSDGTWSYDEDTVLMIRGKTEPFHHTDRNTLTKIAEPTPNPLAQK